MSYLLAVARNILDSAAHNSGRIDRIRAAVVPTVLAAAIGLDCRDQHYSAVLEVVTWDSLAVDLRVRRTYCGRPS